MVVTRQRRAVGAGAAASTAPAHGDDASRGTVLALAQIAPRLGDVATNLQRHLAIISEAENAGAGMVVFPELSLTGYFLKDLVPDVALRVDSSELAALAAASLTVGIVTGCVLETDDARFYNAALLFSGGELRHVHRKVYLPTYGIFDEQRYLAAGHEFRPCELRFGASGRSRWRAGVLLCEDMWHPSAAALLARQGVDVLLCPSASPARGVTRGQALGTAQSYDAITRTYAQLFTAYVVYCNRVGYEDGIGFWGGSRVVAPDGSIVGEAAGAGEELIYHRLERGALRRARIAYPLLRDERNDVTDSETGRIRHRGRDVIDPAIEHTRHRRARD